MYKRDAGGQLSNTPPGHPHYFRIMEKLSVIKTEGANQAIKSVASAAYSTLSGYYGKTKDIAAPYVATICNPRSRVPLEEESSRL
jgi:hypothetical protein